MNKITLIAAVSLLSVMGMVSLAYPGSAVSYTYVVMSVLLFTITAIGGIKTYKAQLKDDVEEIDYIEELERSVITLQDKLAESERNNSTLRVLLEEAGKTKSSK